MKKILLIEDDSMIIDLYRTELEKSGFSVSVIRDGRRVLSSIKKERPDIVLLDIVLPKIDGWEILKEIKSNPEFKDLKVIILSNLGQKSEVERGFKMGASKYLIKAHHTPREIVEEVKKLLVK